MITYTWAKYDEQVTRRSHHGHCQLGNKLKLGETGPISVPLAGPTMRDYRGHRVSKCCVNGRRKLEGAPQICTLFSGDIYIYHIPLLTLLELVRSSTSGGVLNII